MGESVRNRYNGVKTVKPRSLLKDAFVTSGTILLYSLTFTLIGAIFIFAPEMDAVWRLIVGIFFFLPMSILFFYTGKKKANEQFMKSNRKFSETASVKRISPFFGLIFLLPFICLVLILPIIGNLFSVILFQTIGLAILPSTTLCFICFGWISMVKLSWLSLVSVVVFLVINLSFYVLGFMMKEKELAENYRYLANEVHFNSRFQK